MSSDAGVDGREGRGGPASNRDDFPQSTKNMLAQRAGHRCSICRSSTAGPSEDPATSVNLGVGAHITAAAPGGPRFDPEQTSEDRRALGNGIWLCHHCAAQVDRDEARFTVEDLQRYKLQSEASAKAQLDRPDPATIAAESRTSDLLAAIRSAVQLVDFLGVLRHPPEADYNAHVLSGELERLVTDFRARLIGCEILVSAESAALVGDFRRVAEMVALHAGVRPRPDLYRQPELENLKERTWNEMTAGLGQLVRVLRAELESCR